MTDTVLSVRNLQVQFRSDSNLVQAIDDISFQVERGQTLGIVGESGSGKSVTALSIMGLLPPTGRVMGGEIWFHSSAAAETEAINLLALPPHRRREYRGGEISMIFQEPMSSLNPVYTIGFQLTEAICLHQQISEAEARRRAIALLQEVKLLPSDEILEQRYLKEFTAQNPGQEPPTGGALQRQINAQKLAVLDRYPHQLSGGQIQRVMIAMAISCNPTLLIADEPTTALDVTVQATILDLLRELRDRRQMSILFITHDLGIIAEIADTVAVMYQGKVVEYGSTEAIFTRPQHPYTKGLLTCRPSPDRQLKYLPTVADFMEVVLSPTGEQALVEVVREQLPEEDRLEIEITPAELAQRLQALQQQAPLLSVRNLHVAFPVKGLFGQVKRHVMAVDDVSFEVYPGETLGLVGESGCGKTTLARALLRLVPVTAGQILFEERAVLHLSAPLLRQLRREMQIIFQNPFGSLDPRMTVGNAVMEPLQIHLRQSRKQQRDRAVYLLERVGLSADALPRYPHEFSGGQRQRICIARALALNPKFIICDESVSALDVSVQAQVLNLLKELQEEFGLTYIFISHDLSVVKFMSDRIMVMNQGRIEELGPAEQIYRQPAQAYTRELIAAIPTGKFTQRQPK
ncbi:ABC transporter ATP-binding protein [Leptolyngbya sp. 'hensonii']|uniref:ABC transporter ATP-binding protein n=1 Tax=Leptolyngbya sp. 'hensonii' TaxID=1922337 RepID=UPI0009500508|nr:ABC transporter ATP-binding protein [Leptolyngbya sp. 'hensonii']OLP19561.1 ABC transporter ATP-binding protein [Leptolyngbya sp. 'hensonii']